MTRSKPRKLSAAAGAIVLAAATTAGLRGSSDSNSDPDTPPPKGAKCGAERVLTQIQTSTPLALTAGPTEDAACGGDPAHRSQRAVRTRDATTDTDALLEERLTTVERRLQELTSATHQHTQTPPTDGAPQTTAGDRFDQLLALVSAQQSHIASLTALVLASRAGAGADAGGHAPMQQAHAAASAPMRGSYAAAAAPTQPHAVVPASAVPGRVAAAAKPVSAGAPVVAAAAAAGQRAAATPAPRSGPPAQGTQRGLAALAAAKTVRRTFLVSLAPAAVECLLGQRSTWACGSVCEDEGASVAWRCASSLMVALAHLAPSYASGVLGYQGELTEEPSCGEWVPWAPLESVCFLNAKPGATAWAVPVPRGGESLRMMFTVSTDRVADFVVRYRHLLGAKRAAWRMEKDTYTWTPRPPSATAARRGRPTPQPPASVTIFEVLTDREEQQRKALWPAFRAAMAAGRKAQFSRARLFVDGVQVHAHAC